MPAAPQIHPHTRRGPPTFSAIFMDEKGKNDNPSTFLAIFMDEKGKNDNPSTFSGNFVDGKRESEAGGPERDG